MEINLQELNYKDIIKIDTDVNFIGDNYKTIDIVSLNNCHVNGDITLDIEYNYVINFSLNGTMILHDAIDYKEIPYDFSIDIEETLENSLKTLDLIEFLWHYIVLEIPLRFTTCDDIEKIEKDGYQVISEEVYKKLNNPFKDYFEE